MLQVYKLSRVLNCECTNTELHPIHTKQIFPDKERSRPEIHDLENSELMPRAVREDSFENKQALTKFCSKRK